MGDEKSRGFVEPGVLVIRDDAGTTAVASRYTYALTKGGVLLGEACPTPPHVINMLPQMKLRAACCRV